MCQRKFRPIKYTRRYSYAKFGTFFGPPVIIGKTRCLEKDTIQGCIPGSRVRGWPRRRWRNDISEWTGLGINDAATSAEDKDGWRTVIHATNLLSYSYSTSLHSHSLFASSVTACVTWSLSGVTGVTVPCHTKASCMCLVERVRNQTRKWRWEANVNWIARHCGQSYCNVCSLLQYTSTFTCKHCVLNFNFIASRKTNYCETIATWFSIFSVSR